MSVKMKISVRVQDKNMREDGPIQGAVVSLLWRPKEDTPDGNLTFPRNRNTDSMGMAVFLVPPAVYKIKVNAPEYKDVIEDAVGNVTALLTIDTMRGGDEYPVVCNMTRDE